MNYLPDAQNLLQELRSIGEKNPTGHIFIDRNSLPDRVSSHVRRTCEQLHIPCLGTHGFRKAFANAVYQKNRKTGQSDPQALLETARELDHNRAEVTRQSYVSDDERKQSYGKPS